MDEYLSTEIRTSLGEVSASPSKRLMVVSDGRRIPVCRRWKTGFSVGEENARHLRGLVELYEGDQLLGWCLVCHEAADGAEQRFEFKRFVGAGETAPVDFERMSEDVPADGPIRMV